MELRRTLHKMFSNIGKTNGTAPPKSQDKMDAALHELFVANEIRMLSSKRHEEALIDVKNYGGDAMDHDLDVHSIRVASSGIKTDINLADTAHYVLTCEIKKPGQTFDRAAFTVAASKLGLDEKKIEQLLVASYKTNQPAKTFRVLPRE